MIIEILNTADNDNSVADKVYRLIAPRNRPMLTALDLCIEQLERFSRDDPAVQYALKCATTATKRERDFQSHASNT